jgi:hypothetical protein
MPDRYLRAKPFNCEESRDEAETVERGEAAKRGQVAAAVCTNIVAVVLPRKPNTLSFDAGTELLYRNYVGLPDATSYRAQGGTASQPT